MISKPRIRILWGATKILRPLLRHSCKALSMHVSLGYLSARCIPDMYGRFVGSFKVFFESVETNGLNEICNISIFLNAWQWCHALRICIWRKTLQTSCAMLNIFLTIGCLLWRPKHPTSHPKPFELSAGRGHGVVGWQQFLVRLTCSVHVKSLALWISISRCHLQLICHWNEVFPTHLLAIATPSPISGQHEHFAFHHPYDVH